LKLGGRGAGVVTPKEHVPGERIGAG
jgi:hypothetical protein